METITASNQVQTSLATQLPSEVLAKIFLYTKEVPLHNQSLISPPDVVANVKNESQVCRRWREASLDCSALWNNIADFVRPVAGSYHNWIELCLDRSLPLPFKAQISFPTLVQWQAMRLPGAEPPEFQATRSMAILFTNLKQLGHLQIFITANDCYPVISYLQEQLRQPAPKLKNVEYQLHRSPSNRHFNDLTKIYSIDAPLFSSSNTVEKLRLRAIEVTPEIARQCFFHLTDLKVEFDSDRPYDASTSTSEWLDILRYAPHLKTLRISDWMEDRSRGQPNLAKVELPDLETLYLDRDIGGCFGFLDNLIFPPLASFSLHCRHGIPVADWRSIHAYLCKNYNFMGSHQDIACVNVSFGQSTFEFSVEDRIGHYCLEFELSPHIDDAIEFSNYEPRLSDLFRNVGNTKKLSLFLLGKDSEGGDTANVEDLREALLPFKEATIVTTDSMEVFLSIFGMDEGGWDDEDEDEAEEEHDGAEQDEGVEELKAIGALLPAASDMRCFKESDFWDLDIWPRLVKFVRKRKRAGCSILRLEVEIEELEIPGTDQTCQEYIDAIKELGVEVVARVR